MMLARKIKRGLRAVIYARYSSTAQNDASIEQQVEKDTEYAEKNGLTIVEIYSDRARTGKTDDRPDFQRMMRDAPKGKFDYVIAWKSNRMGRNMMEAMINEAKLREMGIPTLYVEEDFDDSAAGRFALRSMMNVNQFFSESMAEDIRRGLEDNAKQCRVNGKIAYGYKKGADRRYEINENTGPIVQESYARIEADEAEVDIYEDYNRRGIPSPSGGKWTKHSLHSILTNPRYMGIYIFGEIRIEGGIPILIRKEQFYNVQEKLNRRKAVRGRHRDNGRYLLTGKLFCGNCGGHMVGMSGTSKLGNPYFYYACQTRRNEKTCSKKNVRRDVIEKKIACAVQQQVLQEDVMEWIADSVLEYQKKCMDQTDIRLYQDRLSEIRVSISNIMKAIEMGVITETTKDRLVELEGERKLYEGKLEREKHTIPNVTREQILYWLESFRYGDVNDKEFQKKLIDAFIVAVYLYDDKIKYVFDYSGDKNTIWETITLEDVDSEDGAECSYKACEGVPLQAQANTIFMKKGRFVCVFYVSDWDE